MRGALIGFGNIAALGHLPAFRELGIEIVAAVDVCENRRKTAREKGLLAFKNLSELEGLDLDFIDICTPPSVRYDPFKFAVDHGLDVICEKPISIPEEISRVKGLLFQSDIFFYPVHNWKHSPHYTKVMDIVKENGGIENLQMKTLRTQFSPGNPDWKPEWRVDKSISGGGIIMDHGYHNIYLAMHLFESEFTQAVLTEVEYFESHPDIEKRASFSLQFPDDRTAEIILDWNSTKREIKNTIFECNQKLELSDRQIVNSDHTYTFDESLSGDSVHGTWFKDVFRGFIKLRKTKKKDHFNEAVKVLEGIDSLYNQAKG
jgi:predicted dehydrogenase